MRNSARVVRLRTPAAARRAWPLPRGATTGQRYHRHHPQAVEAETGGDEGAGGHSGARAGPGWCIVTSKLATLKLKPLSSKP